MIDSRDDPLVRLLEQLGAAKPLPETTARALDRVRQMLAQTRVADRSGHKVAGVVRWVAIAAAVFLAVGVSTRLLPTTSGRAWADVQAAMKAVRSVSFRETG